MISERLRQARLASQMTLDELAERLPGPITKQAISKYERGLSQPSAARLVELANALGVRTSFLLSEPMVRVTWRGYRKHASLTKGEAERLTATAEKRLEGELRFRELYGFSSEHQIPVDSGTPSAEGAELAAVTVREQWGLGEDPIRSVVETIEERGGVVLAWPDGPRFDGLSGTTDAEVAVIVVNADRSVDRVRFDAAHELGHLVMRSSGDERTDERLAHRFAAAFLVPQAAALRELGAFRRTVSLPELGLLKKRWGLSMQAWAFRAGDLGVIDPSTTQSFHIEFRRRGWHKAEPYSFEGSEEPVLLRRLLWRAIAERSITKADARAVLPDFEDEPEARLEMGRPTFRELLKMGRAEREHVMARIAGAVEVGDEFDEWGASDAFVEEVD